MRLTREILIKFARETALQRAKVSRRIICIYLTGSILDESPLIGGTTDIDLIIVQDSEPLQKREIVRITDDIHLDIAHYDQAVFHTPRRLRTDPWLGSFIYKKPLILHDTQHFFEFTQAAVGAQFQQPEYVAQRAFNLAQAARQKWMELQLNPETNLAARIVDYHRALQDGGNALACLNGEPIAERRFFLIFPQRMQSINRPDLTTSLIHLFMPENDEWQAFWPDWLKAWNETVQAAGALPDCAIQLHPARTAYYEKAISALWNENISAALWLMLHTWALAASLLPDTSPLYEKWISAMQSLGFSEAGFDEHLANMDHFLDQVEEETETWAQQNGVSITNEL